MTEQEYHDLLIRLDTRQASMEKKIDKMESKLEEPRQCATHTEKLKTHDRLIWGAVGVALAAMVKSFWSTITGS